MRMVSSLSKSVGVEAVEREQGHLWPWPATFTLFVGLISSLRKEKTVFCQSTGSMFRRYFTIIARSAFLE